MKPTSFRHREVRGRARDVSSHGMVVIVSVHVHVTLSVHGLELANFAVPDKMTSPNSMLSSFQLDPVLSIRASREHNRVHNFIDSVHIYTSMKL